MKYYRAPKAGGIFLSALTAVGSVIDPRHPHSHNEARATFIQPLTYDWGGTATFTFLPSTALAGSEFGGWPPEDFYAQLPKILKQT